jgi:hypothetical protein
MDKQIPHFRATFEQLLLRFGHKRTTFRAKSALSAAARVGGAVSPLRLGPLIPKLRIAQSLRDLIHEWLDECPG